MKIICGTRPRKNHMFFFLIIVLFVSMLPLGCNGPSGNGDSDDDVTWYRDFDGDGYSNGWTQEAETRPQNYYAENELLAISGDCNDNDPGIFPGCPEIYCDGIDQNCDGVDDCPDTWYKDQDTDGYSDGTSQTGGDQPQYYYLADDLIATSGDCNDDDAGINPGQDDIACDGIDQNCNGYDDCPVTWYKDNDGDRYSDGNTVEAVLQPAGYRAPGNLLATSGDCDDSDAQIHPNRNEIFCDGIDQDCDGDDYCPTTYYKDLDADGYSDGYTILAEDQPEGYAEESELTATTGDCNDHVAAFHPDASEICHDRLDNNCDGQIDEACVDYDTLALICDLDQGAPNALEYDPAATPHTVFILNPDGLPHEWNINLPEPWIPQSVETTQITACVGETYNHLIETCNYIPYGTWRRYRKHVDITIKTTQTADTITTFTARGPSPSGCPGVIYNSGSSHGGPVRFVDALPGFIHHVKGSYRPYNGSTPWGIDFDGSDLWVVDSSDDTVKKIDPSGTILNAFGTPGGDPRGIAFDGTYLYVVDDADESIYKLDTGGTLVQTFDLSGIFGFTEFFDICFDGTDLWLLEAYGSPEIYQLSTSGDQLSHFDLFGSGVWDAHGLTFDGVYFWLITDGGDQIYQVDTNGDIIGSYDAPQGDLRGLTFHSNHLWVAVENFGVFYRVFIGDDLFLYQNATGNDVTALAHDGIYLYANGNEGIDANIYKLDNNGDILSAFEGPEAGVADLAFDDNYLWMIPGGGGFDEIYQYDRNGNYTMEIQSPASFPDGIASDSNNLYIPDNITGIIYQTDFSGNITGMLAPGIGYMDKLAWDGSHLWTVSRHEDNLYKINPAESRLSYFEIDGISTPDAIAYDGADIWVALFDTLYQVNTDGLILNSITLTNLPQGTATPDIVALTHDGTNFWASDRQNDRCYQVGSDGTVLTSFTPLDDQDTCDTVSGMAFDGSSLWVSCEDDDTIYELSTDGSQLGNTIEYPDHSTAGLAWDGTNLVLLSGHGNVFLIDINTGDVMTEFENAPGNWYKDIAYDGTSIWIAADQIYQFELNQPAPEAIPVPDLNIAALTHDGTYLWVVDGASETIQKLNQDGSSEDAFGIPGYEWYRGITTNGNNFWITDSLDCKIYQTDLDGVMQKSFSTPGSNPWGLTHDGNHLWAIDADTQTVYQMDENGSVVDSFVSPASDPRGLAYANGRLWLAAESDFKLYQLQSDGSVISETLLPVAEPRGMAYDGSHLWVGNDADDRVYRIDAAGNIIGFVALPATDLRGLTFDGTYLWVADDGRHRMIRINPADWVVFP